MKFLRSSDSSKYDDYKLPNKLLRNLKKKSKSVIELRESDK